MAQTFGSRAGTVHNIRETYVSGEANVHIGDKYVGTFDQEDDTATNKEKAKAAFLRSLSFPEMEHRYQSVDDAISNTCQWFLNHEYYKQWEHGNLSTAPERLLWLRGKPGSGKSTIMKRALLDSRSKLNTRDDQTVHTRLVCCFFFNIRGSELESKPEGFFRSMLVQLYEHADLELGSEPLKAFLRKYLLLAKGWQWTISELRDMFRQALLQPRLDMVMYVDALDECDATTHRDLVDLLCDLLDRAHRNKARLKICISSRHYPNIRVNGCPTVIAEDYNRHDIMTYVTEKLQMVDNISALSTEITTQSTGIFLWVVLVGSKLREAAEDGEPRSVLLKILSSTPKDLGDVFRALLDSIKDVEERRQSLLLLLFVLCARRPLNVKELRLALAFTRKYLSLSEYQHSDDFLNENQLERLIVKRSRGLIEVVPHSEIHHSVQFIHASVKEFLLENCVLLVPHISCREDLLTMAHDELARSCFNFCKVNDHQNDASDDQNALYDYSFQYACEHAKEAEIAGVSQAHAAEVLDYVHLQDANSSASFLYYLRMGIFAQFCRHQLISVIDALPRPMPSAVATFIGFRSALHTAIRENQDAVVRALIRTGASLDGGKGTKYTPVYTAVASSTLLILQLLLQGGATPNLQGEYGSALNLAASEGKEEHVRLLLSHNADTTLSDELYSYPLLTATSEGHLSIVDLLLDNDAPISMRQQYILGVYPFNETHPLQEASYWGYEAILTSLLRAAGRKGVQEEYYKEAYVAASRSGNVHCVALIRLAAQRRGFANTSDNAWYHQAIAKLSSWSWVLPSRDKVTVGVKLMTGRWMSVSLRGHSPGLLLKEIIYKREGHPPNYIALIIRHNYRRITDDARLCDIGVYDSCKIEMVMPFKPRTYWVDDTVAMQRAIQISAEEARRRTHPNHSAQMVIAASQHERQRATPISRRQQPHYSIGMDIIASRQDEHYQNPYRSDSVTRHARERDYYP